MQNSCKEGSEEDNVEQLTLKAHVGEGSDVCLLGAVLAQTVEKQTSLGILQFTAFPSHLFTPVALSSIDFPSLYGATFEGSVQELVQLFAFVVPVVLLCGCSLGSRACWSEVCRQHQVSPHTGWTSRWIETVLAILCSVYSPRSSRGAPFAILAINQSILIPKDDMIGLPPVCDQLGVATRLAIDSRWQVQLSHRRSGRVRKAHLSFMQLLEDLQRQALAKKN